VRKSSAVFGKTTMNNISDLGSREDAPQKPNCRSLVQGIERQGFWRHLPSRSSVRAELRDGDSSVAVENVILFSLVYRRDRALSFQYGSKRKEESKGLPACLPLLASPRPRPRSDPTRPPAAAARARTCGTPLSVS
jgi:hypothetical protein